MKNEEVKALIIWKIYKNDMEDYEPEMTTRRNEMEESGGVT